MPQILIHCSTIWRCLFSTWWHSMLYYLLAHVLPSVWCIWNSDTTFWSVYEMLVKCTKNVNRKESVNRIFQNHCNLSLVIEYSVLSSFNLCLGLKSGLFPWGFLTVILYACIIFPMHATGHVHSRLADMPCHIITVHNLTSNFSGSFWLCKLHRQLCSSKFSAPTSCSFNGTGVRI
jgi:hypothetical protein